jgi:hypothetical protein
MTTLSVKIVGIEGDSVLIKYASENSAKSIDDYDAVAYQPRIMGYTDLDEFLEAVKPGLLAQVMVRDKIEAAPAELDLSSWEGHESTHHEFAIPEAGIHQVIVNESEVIL